MAITESWPCALMHSLANKQLTHPSWRMDSHCCNNRNNDDTITHWSRLPKYQTGIPIMISKCYNEEKCFAKACNAFFVDCYRGIWLISAWVLDGSTNIFMLVNQIMMKLMDVYFLSTVFYTTKGPLHHPYLT